MRSASLQLIFRPTMSARIATPPVPGRRCVQSIMPTCWVPAPAATTAPRLRARRLPISRRLRNVPTVTSRLRGHLRTSAMLTLPVTAHPATTERVRLARTLRTCRQATPAPTAIPQRLGLRCGLSITLMPWVVVRHATMAPRSPERHPLTLQRATNAISAMSPRRGRASGLTTHK